MSEKEGLPFLSKLLLKKSTTSLQQGESSGAIPKRKQQLGEDGKKENIFKKEKKNASKTAGNADVTELDLHSQKPSGTETENMPPQPSPKKKNVLPPASPSTNRQSQVTIPQLKRDEATSKEDAANVLNSKKQEIFDGDQNASGAQNDAKPKQKKPDGKSARFKRKESDKQKATNTGTKKKRRFFPRMVKKQKLKTKGGMLEALLMPTEELMQSISEVAPKVETPDPPSPDVSIFAEKEYTYNRKVQKYQWRTRNKVIIGICVSFATVLVILLILTILGYFDDDDDDIDDKSTSNLPSIAWPPLWYEQGNYPDNCVTPFDTYYSVLHCHNMTTFPNLQKVDSLLYAYMYENNWKKIEENSFSLLSNLIWLDLSNDMITDLNARAFNGLSNLKNLSLASNKLASINAEIFSPLISLQSLHLEGNAIVELGKQPFIDMSQLKSLDLSNNGIQALSDGALMGLSKLEELRLNENRLANLKDSQYTMLNRLKYLDLSANSIHSIDKDAFSGMKALTTLFLQDNLIQQIQTGTFKDLNFRQKQGNLNLYNNLITNIMDGTFATSAYMYELDLRKNPLKCDSFSSIPRAVHRQLPMNCDGEPGCENLQCSTHGMCQIDEGFATCACNVGYTGPNCDTDICKNSPGSYLCLCEDGNNCKPPEETRRKKRKAVGIIIAAVILLASVSLVIGVTIRQRKELREKKIQSRRRTERNF